MEISYLVRVVEKSLHEIEDEISRWKDILAVDYTQYLRGDQNSYPDMDLHYMGS